MHQRFNAALSRARDRMYLLRSVGETEFKEDSLNGKIRSYFKHPCRQDAKKVQPLRTGEARITRGFVKQP